MIVLDASAVVELLVGGELGRRVRRVVGGEDAIAPELLDVEVVSAVSRLVRAGAMSDDVASGLVAALRRMPARRIPHRFLMARAWDLRNRVRIADAFYVACAAWAGVPLLTTDARLGRAALPNVTLTVVR